MGIKRPRTQYHTNPTSSIHPSRRPQVPGVIHKKKPHGPPSSLSSTSINHLKKKIRDLSRLLSHNANSETMPADTRQETERALAGYKLELAQAEEEARRKVMEGRYKMVRFFERQKATRRLKKLRKSLDATPEDVGLREQAHIAEVDLNYVLHYPWDRKYVSLYPDRARKDDEAKEAEEKERRDAEELAKKEKGNAEVWREIERRMEVGGLDEPWSGTGLSKAVGGSVLHEKHGKKGEKAVSKEPSRSGGAVEGDTEDGGFFEE